MNMENTETQPEFARANTEHVVGDAMVGARRAAGEIAEVVARDAQRARDAARTLISDHPWRAAAVFGVIGLALGAMLRGR